MKSKISQGQGWYDQKYKGVNLWILICEVVFFIMLPILLVVINNFPDMTIYSMNPANFKSSSNLTKLSDIAFWAKQNIKTKETIQILNKDDQHNSTQFLVVHFKILLWKRKW